MVRYLEQQVVRTVVALCALGVQGVTADVRDDMRDESLALMQLWFGVISGIPNGTDPSTHVRRWCDRLAERLEFIAGDSGQPRDAVLAAQMAVLRLRAQVPPVKKERLAAPKKEALKALEGTQKTIFDVIRERPEVRTSELVSHFNGVLSERTVMRCLRELLQTSHIIRLEQEGAVCYKASVQ